MCWRTYYKSDHFQATPGVGILWIAAQMIAAPGAQLSSGHVLQVSVWASLLFDPETSTQKNFVIFSTNFDIMKL